MHKPAIKKPLLIACLLLSAGLSGCAVFWPQAGNGGFAEHRFDGGFNIQDSKPHLSNLVQANGFSKRGRAAEAQNVHAVAILAFDKRIADLKAHGAERCAPGDLAKSEQLLVRVKREWAGELYDRLCLTLNASNVALMSLINAPRVVNANQAAKSSLIALFMMGS